VVEPDLGLAWVTVPPGAIERYGLTPDDLDGIVEHPRSIQGVKLALLFREMSQGRVKVLASGRSATWTWRSSPIASAGGGHSRASGVALHGTLPEVQAKILAEARAFLKA
jgi:phosphoesterase RecJ-like protein